MGKTILTAVITGAILSVVFLVLYSSQKNGDSLGPDSAGSTRAADPVSSADGSEIKFLKDARSLTEVNAKLRTLNDEIERLKDENDKLRKEFAQIKEDLGNGLATAGVSPTSPPPALKDDTGPGTPPGGNAIIAAFPSAKEDIKEIIQSITKEDHETRREKMNENALEGIPKGAARLAEKFGWDAATQEQFANIILDRHTRVHELTSGVKPEELSDEERRNLHESVRDIVNESNEKLKSLVGENTYKELQPFINPQRGQGGRGPGGPGPGGRRPGGNRPGGNQPGGQNR
jgi:predicted transcriptional regulator